MVKNDYKAESMLSKPGSPRSSTSKATEYSPQSAGSESEVAIAEVHACYSKLSPKLKVASLKGFMPKDRTAVGHGLVKVKVKS